MAATRTKRKAKKASKPEALAPITQPPEPGDAGPQIIYVPSMPAGVRVNEDTALTLSSVFACLRVVSEDVAALPIGVFTKGPDGSSIATPDDPADFILDQQANSETPGYFFRETMIAWAMSWGNGYAEIERDLAGRPVALWQLSPDRVEPQRDGGQIVYEVSNTQGPPTFLDAEDVFHLRGLGYDGLMGYSVISLGARSIGLGMSLDESAASFSANDSTPGGVLKTPQKLSEEASRRLQETWGKRHGGPNNRRKVAILEQGLDWSATSIPPEDAQLLQSRQFTPAEICRWFRVKPHKIADLSRATFSNIESESTDHVNDSLIPWIKRFEAEANSKLFQRPSKRFVRINVMGRLRGDAIARSRLYTAMLDRGVYSINDIRKLDDLNPIGPDGDKRFIQLNMQLLENAGMNPPQPGSPGSIPPPDPNADNPDDPNADDLIGDFAEQMRTFFRPVLEAACERVARRADHRIKDALKRFKGKPMEEYIEWVDRFGVEHQEYAADEFKPVAQSMARYIGAHQLGAEAAAEMFAKTNVLMQTSAAKNMMADQMAGTLEDLTVNYPAEANTLFDSIYQVCKGTE